MLSNWGTGEDSWESLGQQGSVNPKWNQLLIVIGRTETEVPIFWPPDVKSRLTGKDPDAGKDRGQEEKELTEDKMVRWHHLLTEHESEQALWASEGQGSLECCNPWGSQSGHDWEMEQLSHYLWNSLTCPSTGFQKHPDGSLSWYVLCSYIRVVPGLCEYGRWPFHCSCLGLRVIQWCWMCSSFPKTIFKEAPDIISFHIDTSLSISDHFTSLLFEVNS